MSNPPVHELHSGWARASRLRGLSIVVACMVVPFLWWSAKLGPMRPGGVVTLLSYDQYQYTLPDWTFAAAMLREGIVPLWNPYQLCGTPFFATQHPGIAYPPNWLILFLPVPEVMRILTFVHVALAMGGAFWCARVFGAGRSAALLAGVAYAFSGRLSNIGVITYPAILVSAAWLPWHLGLTRATLVRKTRWQRMAVFLGLSIAMVLLGGHPQYVFMSAQLCGAYAVAHCARLAWLHGGWRAVERAARLGVAAAVAIGASAVQLLPTAELMSRSVRAAGALAGAAANNPFASFLPPRDVLRGLLYPKPGEFGLPGDSYVGTAALVLAAAALCWRPIRGRSWFLVMAAGGATALALADHTPLYRLYLHLPAAGLFRVPQRFIVITTLCLTLLGALGAEALRRSPRPGHSVRLLALGASVPICLWLALRWVTGSWVQNDIGTSSSLVRHAALLLVPVLLMLLVLLRPRRTTVTRDGLLLLIAVASAVELYRSLNPTSAVWGLKIFFRGSRRGKAREIAG